MLTDSLVNKYLPEATDKSPVEVISVLYLCGEWLLQVYHYRHAAAGAATSGTNRRQAALRPRAPGDWPSWLKRDSSKSAVRRVAPKLAATTRRARSPRARARSE